MNTKSAFFYLQFWNENGQNVNCARSFIPHSYSGMDRTPFHPFCSQGQNEQNVANAFCSKHSHSRIVNKKTRSKPPFSFAATPWIRWQFGEPLDNSIVLLLVERSSTSPPCSGWRLLLLIPLLDSEELVLIVLSESLKSVGRGQHSYPTGHFLFQRI